MQMPLAPNEIAPGAIVYFNVHVLNLNTAVLKSGDPVIRQGFWGQFVCYKVTSARSYWTPLTTTFRRERLRIEAAWVVNGYGPLAAGNVYLQDGKNTYVGPNEAFISAAMTERPINGNRPMLDRNGIAAICQVIARRTAEFRTE